MLGFIYATKTYSNVALYYKATLNSTETSWFCCVMLCTFGYDHCYVSLAMTTVIYLWLWPLLCIFGYDHCYISLAM